MIIFDKEYKAIMTSRLPLIYHFASKNVSENTVTLTYKKQKNSPMQQLQTFPFYKPISKFNL